MENLNKNPGQGKTPQQYKDSVNFITIGIGMIILLTLMTLLGGCTTTKKTHVITEWDGDRQINWYTTNEQKGYESKRTD